MKCLPQLFGVDVRTPIPMLFEAVALLSERLGQSLHHLGHELIRLLDSTARFVDETGLDVAPPATKTFSFVPGEQGRAAIVGSGLLASLALSFGSGTVRTLALKGLGRLDPLPCRLDSRGGRRRGLRAVARGCEGGGAQLRILNGLLFTLEPRDSSSRSDSDESFENCNSFSPGRPGGTHVASWCRAQNGVSIGGRPMHEMQLIVDHFGLDQPSIARVETPRRAQASRVRNGAYGQ